MKPHDRKLKKPKLATLRKRYIRIIGAALLVLSILPFFILISAHGPIAAIIVTGCTALVGLILTGSPELVAIVIDMISWIP